MKRRSELSAPRLSKHRNVHRAPDMTEGQAPPRHRFLGNKKAKRCAARLLFAAPPLQVVPDGGHEFFEEVNHLCWIVADAVRISVTRRVR
jgi:hypothetical protein